MRADYSAPEIDVAMAQRVANAQEEAVANFVSARSLTSGTGQFSTGTRASKPSGAALNDLFFESDIGWLDYWAGSAWKYLAGIGAGTNATRAAITVSANDNGAWYWTTDTGKPWRVVAGAWADQFTTIEVTTAVKINANQIIGTRKAAVADVASADATDLATVITLANETKAQLNAWLDRARASTGHGLIS